MVGGEVFEVDVYDTTIEWDTSGSVSGVRRVGGVV